MHLPVMPYAYGSEQDGPSQFDSLFVGPIIGLNLPQKLEQDLWNEDVILNTKI